MRNNPVVGRKNTSPRKRLFTTYSVWREDALTHETRRLSCGKRQWQVFRSCGFMGLFTVSTTPVMQLADDNLSTGYSRVAHLRWPASFGPGSPEMRCRRGGR